MKQAVHASLYPKKGDAHIKEKLTNSPGHILKLGFCYPILDRFYAAAEMQYETERTTVYETETDPYLLTNIHLSTKPLFDHLRLSILVRNLFDVDYKLPGGFEHTQDAIPQDGRNFTVRMGYEL